MDEHAEAIATTQAVHRTGRTALRCHLEVTGNAADGSIVGR